jgi:hypothetical protein
MLVVHANSPQNCRPPLFLQRCIPSSLDFRPPPQHRPIHPLQRQTTAPPCRRTSCTGSFPQVRQERQFPPAPTCRGHARARPRQSRLPKAPAGLGLYGRGKERAIMTAVGLKGRGVSRLVAAVRDKSAWTPGYLPGENEGLSVHKGKSRK